MNNMKKEQLRLYAVTDRTWLGNETLYEQVEKALEGGATLVQLREKELPEADVQKEAEELLELCHRYGVKLILDDDVELAAKVGADGVHIGQSDMELAHAREILGPDKIIGVTAKTVEQAKAAEAGGADYLGSGAVRDFCDFNTAAGFIIVPLCPYFDAAPSGFADFPELVCIFQQESAARKVWAKQRFGDICFWIFQQGNGRITDFCQIKRTDIACHRNRNAHVGIHQNRWECRREQGWFHHGIVIVRDKIHGILVNISE